MRISTVTMYQQSLNAMNRQQGDFLKVGQQLASGKRVVNPSDDPQAASRAVSVSQAAAANKQYGDARTTARNALSQESSLLDSVSDAIIRAQTLLVQASNGVLSDADRASVSSELKGVYETLIGQANATDGNGRYVFGGYQDSAPPFVKNNGRIEYQGDTGIITQQVDASRLMPTSDHGASIFQSVHSASGFVANAQIQDGSNLTFKGPSVVDSNVPHSGFTVSFEEDASGAMTYRIGTDAPQPYVAGEAIRHNGLSITLEGQPKAGDEVAVQAAQDADPNVFRTLENMIAALDKPAETDTEKAQLQNTLSVSNRELRNALDNVLTTNASVGARLNELDTIDSVGGNRALNYASTLSTLVDLDYNAAISEYSLRQVGLQAAQKSFVDIQQLSLFKFL